MDNKAIYLPTEPLSAGAFSAFGQVIEAGGEGQRYLINEGYAKRYHDLARVDVSAGGGRVGLSIFRAQPRTFPMQLHIMERHPLGSQAFIAMSELPFLVVVAPASETLQVDQIRCFLAGKGQGVNYAPGTWHHPLIALNRASDFLVVDRCDGSGNNLDEVRLNDESANAIWLRA
jgi:ureidoglycolate lyase